MLSDTLNTNEVKNSAGTEVEFVTLRKEGREHEYRQIGETPSRPHRIKISHLETGSGVNKIRRSRLGTYKDVDGDVTDSVAPIQVYTVVVAPVGNLDSDAELKNVMAEHISFLASTGADTTIKFDCTGNGAAALIAGDV